MKTGLVMEGGAMRGMFTCGVIDVFMEQNIVFDGAIGVSAGAVFGCNYKSGQIGRPLRYNKAYCKDKRYGSVWSFLKTGDLFDVDFCYHEIPYELDIWDDRAFRNNPMEFYVTCTDAQLGAPVYHKCTTGGSEDILWMQGSASIPGVSKVVHADGYELFDGGISDAVPLKQLEKYGYDRNVVILTQPADYRKTPLKGMPLMRLALRKYPKMIGLIESRPERYNAQVAWICEREAKGEILVIRPKEKLDISSIESNPDKLEAVYQLGREAALEKLEEIRAYLKG